MARLALPDPAAIGRRIAAAWRWTLGAPEARDVFGLVPLMWVLCLTVHGEGWKVPLAPFLLPLAAWLGAARGQAGVAALSVGAAPLLVSLWAPEVSTASSPPGLYFALLLVARFAADRQMRAASFRADGVSRGEVLFLAGTLALAPYFNLTETLGLGLNFRDFVVAACFFTGLSRIGPGAVLGPLALATAVSLTVVGLQSPHLGWRFGPVGLSAPFASTGFLLAAGAAFLAGRVFRHIWARRGAADLRLGARLLAAALLSCALSSAAVALRGDLAGGEASFRLFIAFGSAQATAALLFAAGLAGGWRTAAAAAVLWIAGMWLAPVLALKAGLIGGEAGAGQAAGWLVLSWPPSLVGPSVEIAPHVRAGGLDFLFAVFGWGLAAQRAVPRRRVAAPAHHASPALRVTAFHRALHFVAWLGFAWVGAGFLLGLLATLGLWV